MVSNHTLREETSETNECAAKVQLQQDIQASLDKLKAAWATKIELRNEAEEVDPIPDDVDLDDLFNPEYDDDIMFLDSDSEDDELDTA